MDYREEGMDEEGEGDEEEIAHPRVRQRNRFLLRHFWGAVESPDDDLEVLEADEGEY